MFNYSNDYFDKLREETIKLSKVLSELDSQESKDFVKEMFDRLWQQYPTCYQKQPLESSVIKCVQMPIYEY